MSLIDKAKELSGQAVEQAVEKVGDRGGDDLMANDAWHREATRVNTILDENHCE